MENSFANPKTYYMVLGDRSSMRFVLVFNSSRLTLPALCVCVCHVPVFEFICLFAFAFSVYALVLNFAFTANLPEVRYTATPTTATTTTATTATTVVFCVQFDAMAVAEKASFQFDTDSVWLKFVSLQFLEWKALAVVLCVRAHRRTIYRFHLTNVHNSETYQRRLQ